MRHFRVLENSAVITGPLAGMILAELGAAVTKVEPPAGDQFRKWSPDGEAINPVFASVNRGKASYALDLKSDAGRNEYLALAREADVIIENYRPGVMDRLGIGYSDIRAINSDVIYCHITGQGTAEEVAKRPTFDAVAQALSGLWSQLTDLADPEPVGPPMADMLSGLYASIAILGALHNRSEDDSSVLIELNMVEACLAFQAISIATMQQSGEVPDRLSRARQSQSYALIGSDGLPFAVHLSTPLRFWKSLCETLGAAEFLENDLLDHKSERIAHYDVIRSRLLELARVKTRAEWLALLEDADVPCAPILALPDAIEHVEKLTPEFFGMGGTSSGGYHPVFPARFDGAYLTNAESAPQLDERQP